ncbi:glycosyltransferase family 39 protein [Streptomyces sp. cg35]|uniref:glycosyltransferase family 39 protein n=1 Tax=Streptomyces sp. cg35 TaxID=3421650 RepID=UPI003D169948
MPPTATEAPLLPPARRGRATASASADGLRSRAARSLRRAAPALFAYAAVRTFALLVFAVWAHKEGHGIWPALAADWDSKWYLGIADHGYERTLGTEYDANNLAFFPLYPYLVKAIAVVTPGSRASVGLILAAVCSLPAAWGIFAVGDRLHGRRVGVLLTFLWACFPVGIVQWMGYTESLFTAFVAWSLYAVLTGRWVWAGALAALSGLTRPTGVALAAALVVCGLLTLRRRFSWRVLTGVLLAPLGWLAYVGWVGLRLGRWDGYFAVQRLWHNELDGGVETLRRIRELLAYDSTPELFLVMVTATLLACVVLYALSLRDRQPLPLLVFTGVLLVITLGSGGVYFSRARFLLPAFPLLLPLALVMARASRRFLVLGVTGAVLGAAYCGGYMILVWPSAP